MHILLLRPGAIGDTLLTFPVIAALKEYYSNEHGQPIVTLVGNPAVLPLAQNCRLVDEIYDYEDKRWASLFIPDNPACASDPILQRTAIALCWLRDPDSIVEQNLCSAGIRHVTISPGRPTTDEPLHITTYLARSISLTLDKETMATKYNPLLSNSPTNSPANTPPSAIYGTKNRGPISSRPLSPPSRPLSLSSYPLPLESTHTPHQLYFKPPVAIHPGSGGAQKCWPLEHFAHVIRLLWQRTIPVLLLAGPAEQERLKDLQSILQSPPHPELLRILFNMPLTHLAQELLPCTCYLGNDSGITHLAALLGLPTLSLFLASDPVHWHPIGPHVEILDNAIVPLSPSVVWTALESCL